MTEPTNADRPEWGDVQLDALVDRATARTTMSRRGKDMRRETDADIVIIRELLAALATTRADRETAPAVRPDVTEAMQVIYTEGRQISNFFAVAETLADVMGKFWQCVVDAVAAMPAEVGRGLERYGTDLGTRTHMFTDVSKLRNVPVSGDVLATHRTPPAAHVIDPGCRYGKHDACPGWTWDTERDAETRCACACHGAEWLPEVRHD